VPAPEVEQRGRVDVIEDDRAGSGRCGAHHRIVGPGRESRVLSFGRRQGGRT
jgi:hypothetical protein